jgi:hypothetical protein
VTYRRFPRPGAMCSATAIARHQRPHPLDASIPPEVLEPVGRQGRVRRARDQSMAELCLDCPSVVPVLGECVAASVAEHVRVRLHFKARGPAVRSIIRAKPAVVNGRLALPLEPAQGPEFATVQWMGAGRAVLDPPHVQDGQGPRGSGSARADAPSVPGSNARARSTRCRHRSGI